ncbi:MAG: hypothetical protein LAT50_08875 [Ectothiorhodospiraceae bacterium]|nr:hypothetical protein [Ectothiorhodospiraceae bacterium]
MSDSVAHIPPQGLPMMHILLALLAGMLLYMPMVNLADGGSLSVLDIAGIWGYVTLFMLGLLIGACLILMGTRKLTWGRALLVDLAVVVCLVPEVVGLVIGWEAPAQGATGFG